MSCNITCWVPHCNSSKEKDLDRCFFPLPRGPKFKETWLALTGKKLTIPEEQVFFCDTHFQKSTLTTVDGKVVGHNWNALPFYNMPQMICRTCMVTISSSALFCIVSGTIPSTVPTEVQVETNIDACRPEPLYQILTFCIPNLSIEQNPPSLVCLKCYHMIWHYFIFKLKCNTIETSIQGNLTPEQYGKMVLCRSCPETSCTKFFTIHETQPMGHVFKNLFLSNHPTDIVPLRACLKCWNFLVKLTEFHTQCVNLDSMIQRCVKLNQNQPYSIPPQVTQSVQREFKHQAMVRNSMRTSTDDGASTSTSWNSEVRPTVIQKTAGVIDLTIGTTSNFDPEMPRLVAQAGDQYDERKPDKKCNLKKKSDWSYESKLLLVTLLTKYRYLLNLDLDAAQRAENDLTMWIKVIKEFHGFGNTYKLECIQAMWHKLKRKSKLSSNRIGPMTYLEYTVNDYLSSVRAADSSSSTEWEDESETNDVPSADVEIVAPLDMRITRLESRKKVIDIKPKLEAKVAPSSSKLVNEVNNSLKTRSGRKNLTKKVQNVFIPAGDDSKRCIEKPNAVRGRGRPRKDQNNAICKKKTAVDQRKITTDQRKIVLNKQKAATTQRKVVTAQQKTPASQRKTAARRKLIRKIWDEDQRLQLIREAKKEYNRFIEEEEFTSVRCTPWKRILERLNCTSFRNTDFSKLYQEWNKMKLSASTHEKNGQDILDEEMWDLLQLHADVLKNLPKNGSPSKEERRDSNGAEQKDADVQSTPVVHKNATSSEAEIQVKQEKVKNAGDIKKDLFKKEYKRSKQDEGAKNQDRSDESLPIVKKPKLSHAEEESVDQRRTQKTMLEHEKMEFVHLMEEEMKEQLDKAGRIKSLNEIFRNIKYKDFTFNNLIYTWRKLTASASDSPSVVTPLHLKVLKVLKLYCEDKSSNKKHNFEEILSKNQNVDTKPVNLKEDDDSSSNKSSEASNDIIMGKRRRLAKEEKLALVEVVQSFGNQVFKKCETTKRSGFWDQVAHILKLKGYDMELKLIKYTWYNMLNSAKLTWAQEGRVPRVGDQEVIDFMKKVIAEKQKPQEDSKLDLNADKGDVEEEPVDGTEQKVEEPPNEVKEEQPEGVSNPQVEEKVDNAQEKGSSESDVQSITFDYDYVSFEDVKKHYGKVKATPIGSGEVIEISDSD